MMGGLVLLALVLGAAAGVAWQHRLQKPLEEALALALRERARCTALTDHLPASVAELDLDERYVQVNAHLCESVGAPASGIIGRRISEVRGPHLYEQWKPYLAQAFQGRVVRAWVKTALQGELVHLNTVFVPKRARDGKVIGAYALTFDLTELKQSHNDLEELARIDSLTGIANRRHFEERLRSALAHARRNRRTVAVLAIDVDDFKAVNDTHGHAAGDAVLREVVTRMQRCIRQDDFLARLGGDEFVLLVEEPPQAAGEIIARKLLACVRAPVASNGLELPVTLSIGVAYGDGDSTPAQLLERADEALYEAKRAGKATFRSRQLASPRP